MEGGEGEGERKRERGRGVLEDEVRGYRNQ